MKIDKSNKAWQILNQDEQTALLLKYGHEKSTWQTGEIMRKSHYKYLEIQERGKKFLKLFTEHFALTGGDLVPSNIRVSEEFKMFLEGTILGRKTPKEVLAEKSFNKFLNSRLRKELIIKEMNKLKNSDNELDLYFYGVINDFDRWNNHRILPPEIREPSAFKRRDKTRHKKHLNKIINLHAFAIEYLTQKYIYDTDIKLNPGYVVLIQEKDVNMAQILCIKRDKPVLTHFTKHGFYIFSSRKDAIAFKTILIGYLENNKNSPSYGLRFWPRYRELIKKAVNHSEIAHIVVSRKFIEFADEKVSDKELINRTTPIE